MIALVSAALAGELVVVVHDLRPDHAPVEVSLFADAASFPSAARASRRIVDRADGSVLRVSFGVVPDGRWAITAHHDENNNGKLDFSWLPPGPAEGTSASCASRPLAIPTWGSCSIDVRGAETVVDLTMWY